MMMMLGLYHLDHQLTSLLKTDDDDDDNDDDYYCDVFDDNDDDETVTLQPVIVGDNVWMVECRQNTNLENNDQMNFSLTLSTMIMMLMMLWENFENILGSGQILTVLKSILL